MPTRTQMAPVRAVTRGPRHHFFGYYDKCPWDASGRYMLAVETTFGIIADIRRQGTTILMVEQNAYLALQMADRGYVMETGRIVLAGDARDLMTNDHVRRAYLGG